MKLALRTSPQRDATFLQEASSAAIKARLVSQYCHGGIVIDGRMYHATSAKNLHMLEAHEWTPERWELVDLGPGRDAEALALFEKHKGAKYDWFGLLAFVGLPFGNDGKLYCFEWCWLAMTGEMPKGRVTPEMLMRAAWPDCVEGLVHGE